MNGKQEIEIVRAHLTAVDPLLYVHFEWEIGKMLSLYSGSSDYMVLFCKPPFYCFVGFRRNRREHDHSVTRTLATTKCCHVALLISWSVRRS